MTKEELEAAREAASEAANETAEAAKETAPASGSEMGVRSPSAGPVSSGEEEEKAGYGNLILARSKDLLHWEYVGHLLDEDTEGQIHLDPEHFRLNGVYECPDYIVLDGKEIILSSPQNLPPGRKAGPEPILCPGR